MRWCLNTIKLVSVLHLESGITLFSRVFENFCKTVGDDTDLIGCFVSAMDSFSKQLGQEGVKQIEMSNLKILMFEKRPILIFFALELIDDLQEYQKKISICANTFLKKYKTELKKNFHHIELFKSFNPIIQEILEFPLEKLNEVCPDCEFEIKRDCLYVHLRDSISDIKSE